MKKGLITSAVALLLASCDLLTGDVVTTRYDTYSDAFADSLFARGWLPQIIPESAARIVTSNNLDINTSHGEFLLPPKEAGPFLERLSPYNGRRSPFVGYGNKVVRRKAQGFEAMEYVDGAQVWIFFVHKKTGHVYYDFWTE